VRLSAIDAFFVAYQAASGASMQLGAELELRGELSRADLEAALATVAGRWPRIARVARRRILGLAWAGPARLSCMLVEGGELEVWRNAPIDPFEAPPFQLLWIRSGEDRHTLAFRAHHAALDGEAFLHVCSEVVEELAGPTDPASPPILPSAPTRSAMPRRLRDLGPMWRYKSWLERQATDSSAARLALASTEPGDIDASGLRVEGAALAGLEARASELGVALPWLVAAGWLRALHRWNLERGIEQRVLSLEFPISLRRRRVDVLGNRVSPLLLMGEGAKQPGELAADLGRQLKLAIRQQAHRAVPLFASPGAWLPWWLFRRVAVRPKTSAFASSHFTWLSRPDDLGRSLGARTGGRLVMEGRRFWTPVCLEMGVALLAFIVPGCLELGMTWRRRALPEDAASRIRALLEEELSSPRG
jgi:hypothetical protein